MARILVVDDDSALRQALGAVLHRSGYEVEQAGSMRAAGARTSAGA